MFTRGLFVILTFVAVLLLGSVVPARCTLSAEAGQPKVRSATVFLNSDGNYSIVDDVKDLTKGLAYGEFLNNVNVTGWGRLKIETNPSMGDEQQAYAAGMLEGYLSGRHIEYYGFDQYKEWGFSPDTKPAALLEFMQENLAFMRSNSAHYTGMKAEIWTQAQLWVNQLDGMYAGYQACKNCKLGYNLMDLFFINASGDLETLVGVYGAANDAQNKIMQPYEFEGLDCSAIVCVLEDGDVGLAHATWRNFMLMNRVYKVTEIFGQVTSFSSSGGQISSKDDFYVTPHNLTVYETTNSIYDTSLYDLLTPKSLLTCVRSVVANRLATTAPAWTDYFGQFNSGTYNNQFGVLDNNKVLAKEEEDVLWIVEQIPGQTVAGDVSPILFVQGFWPSFNVPFFTHIQNISGYPPNSYYTNPRYQIFARDAPTVTTVSGINALIRNNDYETDPYSEGNPKNAVSSRYDLITPTNTSTSFGAVDAKVTSAQTLFQGTDKNTYTVQAVAGPTWGEDSSSKNPLPAFSWAQYPTKPHLGQQYTFQNEFVTMDLQWLSQTA